MIHFHKHSKTFQNSKLNIIFFIKNRNGKLTQIGHKFTINFKLAVVKDSLKYADEKQKNLGYKVIEGRNSSRTKMLKLQRLGRKKSGGDVNENKTYNKRSNSNLFSHSRVSLTHSFFGEEYKQYLTFSVEISTNTPITNYSKHL